MAITAVFDIQRMSAAQYDAVIRELEVTGNGNPEGRRFHVASPRGQGWYVVDIWDSPEELQAFGQVLMPLLARHGVDPLPQPTVLPTHNIISS
ncbi:MAG: hypothetical protein HY532_06910 [Chloroflexi bacterium]|nr:hypothetical protein [Chloroflexota bacterium]